MKNKLRIYICGYYKVSLKLFLCVVNFQNSAYVILIKTLYHFNTEVLFMHRRRPLRTCDRQQKVVKFRENETSKSSKIFKKQGKVSLVSVFPLEKKTNTQFSDTSVMQGRQTTKVHQCWYRRCLWISVRYTKCHKRHPVSQYKQLTWQ